MEISQDLITSEVLNQFLLHQVLSLEQRQQLVNLLDQINSWSDLSSCFSNEVTALFFYGYFTEHVLKQILSENQVHSQAKISLIKITKQIIKGYFKLLVQTLQQDQTYEYSPFIQILFTYLFDLKQNFYATNKLRDEALEVRLRIAEQGWRKDLFKDSPQKLEFVDVLVCFEDAQYMDWQEAKILEYGVKITNEHIKIELTKFPQLKVMTVKINSTYIRQCDRTKYRQFNEKLEPGQEVFSFRKTYYQNNLRCATSTIKSITIKNNVKEALISQQIYSQDGYNQTYVDGALKRYNGYSNYNDQTLSIYSNKIQPLLPYLDCFQRITNDRQCFDHVDYLFDTKEDFKYKFFLPREHLTQSKFFIRMMNMFGQLNGFEALSIYLQQQVKDLKGYFQVLTTVLKSLKNIKNGFNRKFYEEFAGVQLQQSISQNLKHIASTINNNSSEFILNLNEDVIKDLRTEYSGFFCRLLPSEIFEKRFDYIILQLAYNLALTSSIESNILSVQLQSTYVRQDSQWSDLDAFIPDLEEDFLQNKEQYYKRFFSRDFNERCRHNFQKEDQFKLFLNIHWMKCLIKILDKKPDIIGELLTPLFLNGTFYKILLELNYPEKRQQPKILELTIKYMTQHCNEYRFTLENVKMIKYLIDKKFEPQDLLLNSIETIVLQEQRLTENYKFDAQSEFRMLCQKLNFTQVTNILKQAANLIQIPSSSINQVILCQKVYTTVITRCKWLENHFDLCTNLHIQLINSQLDAIEILVVKQIHPKGQNVEESMIHLELRLRFLKFLAFQTIHFNIAHIRKLADILLNNKERDIRLQSLFHTFFASYLSQIQKIEEQRINTQIYESFIDENKNEFDKQIMIETFFYFRNQIQGHFGIIDKNRFQNINTDLNLTYINYRRLSDISKLEGTDMIWKHLMAVKDENVRARSQQFLLKMYFKDHDTFQVDEQKEFITQCCQKLCYATSKDAKLRLLALLEGIVAKYATQNYLSKFNTHAELSGCTLIKKIQVKNEFSPHFEKIQEFEIRMNQTLWDFIVNLSQRIKCDPKYVRVSFHNISKNANRDISELNYHRTFENLLLQPEDQIIIKGSIKFDEAFQKVNLTKQKLENLIDPVTNQLNEKLKEVLTSLYDESTNYNSKHFDKACLESFIGAIDIPLNRGDQIFRKYSEMNDGALSKDEFIQYFTDALRSQQNQQIMFKVLQNHGYLQDLTEISSNFTQTVKSDSAPQFIITGENAYSEILYKLLLMKEDDDYELSEQSYNLLQVLSPNKEFNLKFIDFTRSSLEQVLLQKPTFKKAFMIQILIEELKNNEPQLKDLITRDFSKALLDEIISILQNKQINMTTVQVQILKFELSLILDSLRDQQEIIFDKLSELLNLEGSYLQSSILQFFNVVSNTLDEIESDLSIVCDMLLEVTKYLLGKTYSDKYNQDIHNIFNNLINKDQSNHLSIVSRLIEILQTKIPNNFYKTYTELTIFNSTSSSLLHAQHYSPIQINLISFLLTSLENNFDLLQQHQDLITKVAQNLLRQLNQFKSENEIFIVVEFISSIINDDNIFEVLQDHLQNYVRQVLQNEIIIMTTNGSRGEIYRLAIKIINKMPSKFQEDIQKLIQENQILATQIIQHNYSNKNQIEILAYEVIQNSIQSLLGIKEFTIIIDKSSSSQPDSILHQLKKIQAMKKLNLPLDYFQICRIVSQRIKIKSYKCFKNISIIETILQTMLRENSEIKDNLNDLFLSQEIIIRKCLYCKDQSILRKITRSYSIQLQLDNEEADLMDMIKKERYSDQPCSEMCLKCYNYQMIEVVQIQTLPKYQIVELQRFYLDKKDSQIKIISNTPILPQSLNFNSFKYNSCLESVQLTKNDFTMNKCKELSFSLLHNGIQNCSIANITSVQAGLLYNLGDSNNLTKGSEIIAIYKLNIPEIEIEESKKEDCKRDIQNPESNQLQNIIQTEIIQEQMIRSFEQIQFVLNLYCVYHQDQILRVLILRQAIQLLVIREHFDNQQRDSLEITLKDIINKCKDSFGQDFLQIIAEDEIIELIQTNLTHNERPNQRQNTRNVLCDIIGLIDKGKDVLNREEYTQTLKSLMFKVIKKIKNIGYFSKEYQDFIASIGKQLDIEDLIEFKIVKRISKHFMNPNQIQISQQFVDLLLSIFKMNREEIKLIQPVMLMNKEILNLTIKACNENIELTSLVIRLLKQCFKVMTEEKQLTYIINAFQQILLDSSLNHRLEVFELIFGVPQLFTRSFNVGQKEILKGGLQLLTYINNKCYVYQCSQSYSLLHSITQEEWNTKICLILELLSNLATEKELQDHIDQLPAPTYQYSSIYFWMVDKVQSRIQIIERQIQTNNQNIKQEWVTEVTKLQNIRINLVNLIEDLKAKELSKQYMIVEILKTKKINEVYFKNKLMIEVEEIICDIKESQPTERFNLTYFDKKMFTFPYETRSIMELKRRTDIDLDNEHFDVRYCGDRHDYFKPLIKDQPVLLRLRFSNLTNQEIKCQFKIIYNTNKFRYSLANHKISIGKYNREQLPLIERINTQEQSWKGLKLEIQLENEQNELIEII